MRHAIRTSAHLAVGAVALGLLGPLAALRARRLRAHRRRARLRPRVVWGPIPIVNIHYAAEASRRAGYDATTVVYQTYSINSRLLFDRVYDLFERSWPARVVLPYAVFLRALREFDVFCFYFDGGLLYATPWWRLELVLLRLSGARIVVIPYGGDARLPSTTRRIRPWNALSEVPEGGDAEVEARIRPRLAAFGRYADAILACADIAEDLPRVDGVYRFPFELPAPVDPPSAREHVVVVHAPNHREYKGTAHLIDAVEVLRQEGLPVELDLVEGVPNAEAIRRYARADVVGDQFLAGAYALFAVEAMALGKPVICFLNDRFRPWHPEWEECPIASASPDTLVDVLRRLVVDRGLRTGLGARGPDYVRRYHSLESVGRELAALYERVDGGGLSGARREP